MRMPPVNIFSNRDTYLDAAGKPLALGRLSIYIGNSSTSLASVFSDAALTKPEPNPAPLDSAGRASALYSASSVYVRVEKFIGRDEHGENLYEFVYDYETPPGLDISSFWNMNVVDTYEELRQVANENATIVMREGDPHIYRWNPDRPSRVANEVTDVSSDTNPDGSWHWETKAVYADQCNIRNNGLRFEASWWGVFSSLSVAGYKTIVPKGVYDFNGQTVPDSDFRMLEIMPNAEFRNLSNLNISATREAACLSPGLPITWKALPGGKTYDTAYFNNIELFANALPIDVQITTPNFSCNKIRYAHLGSLSSANGSAACGIEEIISPAGSTAKLSFSGWCAKARSSNINASNIKDIRFHLLADTAVFSQDFQAVPGDDQSCWISRLSVLPGGSVQGGKKLIVYELDAVRNSIDCPFEIQREPGQTRSANTFSLDPGIFASYGLEWQLNNAPNWKARGLGNLERLGASNSAVIRARQNQSFTDCDFSSKTIIVNDQEYVSFVNCKIKSLRFYGSPGITCIGCEIDEILPLSTEPNNAQQGISEYFNEGNKPRLMVNSIFLLKTLVRKIAYPNFDVNNFVLSECSPVIAIDTLADLDLVLTPLSQSEIPEIFTGYSGNINQVIGGSVLFRASLNLRPLYFSHAIYHVNQAVGGNTNWFRMIKITGNIMAKIKLSSNFFLDAGFWRIGINYFPRLEDEGRESIFYTLHNSIPSNDIAQSINDEPLLGAVPYSFWDNIGYWAGGSIGMGGSQILAKIPEMNFSC